MKIARLLPVVVACAAGVVGPAALAGETAPTAEDRIKELEEKVRRLEEAQKPAAPPATKDARPPDAADEKKPDAPRPDAPKPDAPKGPEKEKKLLEFDLTNSIKLKIGGQLRLRGEYRSPADYRAPGKFGRAANDRPYEEDDFVLQRTRINLDLTAHDHLRAFVELQDSRTWGETAPNNDSADIHLRQGFVELYDIFDVPLSVKAGRMELPALGDQRLVSPLDWSNVARSWDGVQVTFKPEGWYFTAFAANLKEGRVFAPTLDANDDQWFMGGYASCRVIPGHEIDGYAFWRQLMDRSAVSEPNAALGGATRKGHRKDLTAGMRIKGDWDVVGYSAEACYQWGDQAGDAVRAWAGAAKAWGNLGISDDVKLRIHAEYAYASGDENPTDGTIRTFDPLFSFLHFYHGHQDLFAWSNVHDVNTGIQLTLWKDLSLHADQHFFWLDQRKDAWYAGNKTTIRRDLTGHARSYVGAELDVYAKLKVWKIVNFWVGYSHFWTGAYVRDTGKNRDQDWAFFQAEVNF